MAEDDGFDPPAVDLAAAADDGSNPPAAADEVDDNSPVNIFRRYLSYRPAYDWLWGKLAIHLISNSA